MKQKLIVAVIVLLLIYLLSYVFFRNAHIEIWERDGKAYVIFPSDKVFVYYLFRPLSYADGEITGMRFHIGPHTPPLLKSTVFLHDWKYFKEMNEAFAEFFGEPPPARSTVQGERWPDGSLVAMDAIALTKTEEAT